ncbi:MAG: glycoside hydrolase family 97 protein [Lentisphaerae bacterium]|nr:glycoside hydrolase family 97 protein [Lentisphaerota bacterium]
MKKIACTAVVGFGLCAFAQTVSVKSPDGKNEIRLDTDPVLSYSVYRSGVQRIAPTRLSMEIEGRGVLGRSAKVSSIDTVTLTGKIDTPIYKKSFIDESANRTTVAFDGDWRVVLVARNDGVAYRFETAFPGRVKVLNEMAGVAFPDGVSAAYAAYCRNHGDPLQCSWESIYTTVTNMSDMASGGQVVYLPLVLKYSDGSVMSVSESDLLDYPGWNMKRAVGDRTVLEACMARYPAKVEHRNGSEIGSPDRPLRHIRVKERADYLAETAGTRTFPWRVFMLAESESKLCEADIVYALATPCKLKNTEWIKPGKVAWEWWNCWNVSRVPFRAGCNTATYEYYIDFAAEFGVEYVIMDEGWSKKLSIMEINPETDVPHLVKYANARGVGIILWCAWPQLVGRQHEVFSKYSKMGVKGFKIDFMDRDDQAVENYLEETAKIAAEYRLVVDYHGMHKPTGMSRTYPNILNYEGVHGLECMKWENNTDFMRNDLLGLYCRMSAGPMDYTPGAMLNMTREQFRANTLQPGSQGTRVHQMALMALYEAPLQMLCDSPTQYLRNRECFEFMAKVPVVWDQTVGLPGNIEKCAAIARRKGEVWYVAAINSWEPCKMEIETSFLGEGKWRAEIFADGVNADRDATDYVKTSKAVRAGEKMKIDLAPGGGWVARFVRKGLLW